MGLFLSKVLDRLGGTKEARLLMLGLDAAGKTTVLYKLRHGETITTIPTIGFNVEELQYKKLRMQVWDVGGQQKIRKLWRHYYQGVEGLIYIIDSSDSERIEEAQIELQSILEDEAFPSDACVLIFANKQDLPLAMTPQEVLEKLQLRSMRALQDRPWSVKAACATTGDGLDRGLDWLVGALEQRR